MRHLLVTLVLSAALLAQQPEPACRKDRPVDDYIKELTKSKRSTRNKNPLPDNVCIFGFCVGGKPQPQRRPTQESNPQPEQEAKTYDPIAAAKSTEVGDYYHEEKNYRAALSRYEEAVTLKPGDPTIYVRLGRTLEKMEDYEPAYRAYDSVLKLEPDEKSAAEARKAMERLTSKLEKEGAEPADISRANQPPAAPCIDTVSDAPATN